MLFKGRASRAPLRPRPHTALGGRRRAVVAPPPVLGSTSRPHFRRRASVCRRRCRKPGGRFAASRKMAATTVNGAAGVSSSAAASGAVLQAAAGMYEQLKGEWNRKSPNLSKCGEELGRLKVGVEPPREPGACGRRFQGLITARFRAAAGPRCPPEQGGPGSERPEDPE